MCFFLGTHCGGRRCALPPAPPHPLLFFNRLPLLSTLFRFYSYVFPFVFFLILPFRSFLTIFTTIVLICFFWSLFVFFSFDPYLFFLIPRFCFFLILICFFWSLSRVLRHTLVISRFRRSSGGSGGGLCDAGGLVFAEFFWLKFYKFYPMGSFNFSCTLCRLYVLQFGDFHKLESIQTIWLS